MASRSLLLRAAEVVAEQARLERESCQIVKPGGPIDWACHDCDPSTCLTKKRYEEMLALENELRAAA